MGPFGVIPKLFRVEGYSERKAVPNGRPPQRAVEAKWLQSGRWGQNGSTSAGALF